MRAAILSAYRDAPLPQRLLAGAVVAYLVVFTLLGTTGRAGIGIGQGFYVPIVLASLGGTYATGVAAGLVAALLYEVGLAVGGARPTPLGGVVHLVAYIAAGAIVGHFATRARSMLSDALRVLDDLLRVARRDLHTGALDVRGFDGTLQEWLARGAPFALLVGDVDCRSRDEAGLRRAASALRARSAANAEIARVGPTQFAVLTWGAGDGPARAAAVELELALADDGCCVSFGWAAAPAEGSDGLTLFRAATERLYARRIVRGEWTPTPAAAGLVDEAASPV